MITEIKWGFVVYISTLTCNKTWYTQDFSVSLALFGLSLILKCWKSD